MTTRKQDRSGPCAGLKVLDLSTMISGPMGGQIFGDLGADVIKLEAIGGDTMRESSPQYKGLSAYFVQYNRNKRSISVDLKSKDGQEIARKLALETDVLIENFRPGVAERLQVGYESLRSENPGLVYISVKGFGEDGPDKDLPAYDPVIQALGGFMMIQGGNGSPAPIRNAVVDKVTAMSGAMSALAALWSRERNGGNGQKIVVKMVDAWAAFISQEELRNHTFLGSEIPPLPKQSMYRVFKATDGYAMGLIIQDNQFRGICEAVSRPDLLSDARFEKLRSRLLNIEQLNEELASSIADMKVDDLLSGARRHGVPMARVHSLDQFFDHPQARHNNTFPVFSDPEFGDIRGLSFYAAFLGTPLELQSRAPTLGEQTDEILGEMGFGPAEVQRLRKADVVR